MSTYLPASDPVKQRSPLRLEEDRRKQHSPCWEFRVSYGPAPLFDAYGLLRGFTPVTHANPGGQLPYPLSIHNGSVQRFVKEVTQLDCGLFQVDFLIRGRSALEWADRVLATVEASPPSAPALTVRNRSTNQVVTRADTLLLLHGRHLDCSIPLQMDLPQEVDHDIPQLREDSGAPRPVAPRPSHRQRNSTDRRGNDLDRGDPHRVHGARRANRR